MTDLKKRYRSICLKSAEMKLLKKIFINKIQQNSSKHAIHIRQFIKVDDYLNQQFENKTNFLFKLIYDCYSFTYFC